MVFEKKTAAGRGARSWMNVAFRSCENLFYPATGRPGIIRKDGFGVSSPEPELVDQSERRLAHKECETCLMTQNAGIRAACVHGNVAAISCH